MLKKLLLSAFAFAFIPSIVFATDIGCPEISTIRVARDKLNSAEKIGISTYRVFSSYVAFRESNLPWYVEANHIDATSTSDALAAGRTLLFHTTMRKNDVATKNGHYYNCYYGDGEIVVTSGYVV
jgi:hypothetical protein